MPTPTLVLEDGSGLTNSNAYADVSEADAYHDAHLYASTWIAATTANKTIALIWATRILDEQAEWKGSKAHDTQALRWPRTDVLDPDGVELAGDAIPTWLKAATSECARVLLSTDRTAESDKAGLKQVTVGPITLIVDPLTELPILPRSVISILQPYARIKGLKTGWVKLLRV
jgi:hypothetical protein